MVGKPINVSFGGLKFTGLLKRDSKRNTDYFLELPLEGRARLEYIRITRNGKTDRVHLYRDSGVKIRSFYISPKEATFGRSNPDYFPAPESYRIENS